MCTSGRFRRPAREDDPRAVIENFNYDQEDLLGRRSEDRPWTWSASRPNTLLHFSPAIARNLVSSLGAYAAICRELGCALDFPGPEGAYRSLTQVTSIELLARAMAWMATEPACANQAFNVTNGDVFRWSRLWPRIAGAFDMPCGSVRPLRLAMVMQGKEAVWERVCERFGLARQPLSAVANWGYLDATLERTWGRDSQHREGASVRLSRLGGQRGAAARAHRRVPGGEDPALRAKAGPAGAIVHGASSVPAARSRKVNAPREGSGPLRRDSEAPPLRRGGRAAVRGRGAPGRTEWGCATRRRRCRAGPHARPR